MIAGRCTDPKNSHLQRFPPKVAAQMWSKLAQICRRRAVPTPYLSTTIIIMPATIRYALPQRPAVVAAVGIAAWYFGRENRDFANLFGGTANLDKWFYLIAKLHAAEAAAMLVYSLYRGADLVTSLQYTATQLVVGFPTYFQFKRLNN